VQPWSIGSHCIRHLIVDRAAQFRAPVCSLLALIPNKVSCDSLWQNSDCCGKSREMCSKDCSSQLFMALTRGHVEAAEGTGPCRGTPAQHRDSVMARHAHHCIVWDGCLLVYPGEVSFLAAWVDFLHAHIGGAAWHDTVWGEIQDCVFDCMRQKNRNQHKGRISLKTRSFQLTMYARLPLMHISQGHPNNLCVVNTVFWRCEPRNSILVPQNVQPWWPWHGVNPNLKGITPEGRLAHPTTCGVLP
jgi:hypothetical protein